MSAEFRDIPVKTINRLGYVPRWLLCGPLPAGDTEEVFRLYSMGRLEAPDFDPLGGELFLDPYPGLRQGSSLLPEGEVIWKEISIESPSLNLSFPGVDYGLVYAATKINSPKEGLLICDFQPRAAGLLILNQDYLSPDHGLVQVPLVSGGNTLILKILGGSLRRIGWGAVCKFLPARYIPKTGVAMTAPRATGFYRGTAETPELEIEFVLANSTDSDVFDATVNLSCGKTEISRAVELLKAWETRRLRYGLPVAKGGFDGDRIRLDVSVGQDRSSIGNALGDAKPPGENGRIFVGIGFHCDPIWVNTQSMYNDISLNNVTQYLNFCRADPDFKVILHELDYLKPYLDFYPGDRDYMKALAKEGRLILGGSYNEPNEKNVSGEQLIRNIVYGKLFASSQFGVDPKVYHGWDVFGHVPQLSQILSKCGFTGIIWSKGVKGFPALFRHMALDGSTLLHRRVHYGFDTRGFDELRGRCYAGFAEMRSLGHSVDLRMDSDDFRSPTAWMLGRSEELKSLLPAIETADPADFFNEILREESNGVPVTVTSRDASQYHIGTSQSRIELKIANRLGEIQLYNAELLSTLASLMGRPYPDIALDKAWRQILFNSHHDAITGTSCDMSYLDMLQAYRDALGHLGREVREGLQFVAESIDTSDSEGIPIVVFNTLNWERKDVARVRLTFDKPVANFGLFDSEGKKVQYCAINLEKTEAGIKSALIEFVATTPSVGYAIYRAIEARGGNIPLLRKKSDVLEIENEYFRVSVDPSRGGGISSIVDKRSKRELVPQNSGQPANEIALLKEKNDRHEPSWEFHTTGDMLFSGSYAAEIEAFGCGSIEQIAVTNQLGETCKLVRKITLRKGIARIEFTTEIEGYDGEDDLFVALFPQDIPGGVPTYEERFGAVVKHKGRNRFDYRTWRMDAFSDCVIHSCQNFFDVGSTTKIRFMDHQAKEVSSAPLGSTLLVLSHSKEVQYISRRLQKALANRGVLTTPMFDDGDAKRRDALVHQDSTEARERNQDLPSTNFRISLGLAGGNSYSTSVLGQVDAGRVGKMRDRINKLGFDFILTLDRDVPDGWDPIPVLIIEAKDSEALERAIDFLVEGLSIGDLILPEHANDLGSNSVDNYGISILNRGNMASTVEPDGTMTLFLKHSANWSTVFLDEKFVPERMDHRFLYAMYPHQGSWREAFSYRRGWEFNNPMICTQTGKHRGVLPQNNSFLKVSAENVVVSAIKPVGNPVAAFTSVPSDPARGITLRIYDAEGKKTKVNFEFSFPIDGAWKTDMLEARDSEIEASESTLSDEIGPFSVETYEVIPSSSLGKAAGELPPLLEPVQPVYSKYWKENLSAAPLGYQPVAISIQGSPITEVGSRGTTTNRISISIVNDYVDRNIEGYAVMEGPEGWRIQPEKIWYDVPPLGHTSHDVVITFSGPRRTGLLRARLCHNGQVHQDVIEIGKPGKSSRVAMSKNGREKKIERSLNWSATSTGDRVLVRIENPYNERVEGGVTLIGSIGTWSPEEAGDYSLFEVGPSVRAFSIKAKSSEILEFKLSDGGAHYWLYAKLYYMGRTEYRRVR